VRLGATIAVLLVSAWPVRAGWSVAWTNDSIWPSWSCPNDLRVACAERNAVLQPWGTLVQSVPAEPSIWPSAAWLGQVDKWLMVNALLPGSPGPVTSVEGTLHRRFIDPYLASGTSFATAFNTNANVRLTWTNAMKYAGLTATHNFTRPTWRWVPATGWVAEDNSPFWLRISDMEERRKVLDLLRWTQQDTASGGTNVWYFKPLDFAFEAPSLPACDVRTPVQELPSEFSWTNLPSGSLYWSINTASYWDDDDDIWYIPSGVATRFDGLATTATGEIEATSLEMFDFSDWEFPDIRWPAAYWLSAVQVTNYASATDLYAKWETNVLAAVTSTYLTEIDFETPYITVGECALDFPPADADRLITNAQPEASWPLPLTYEIAATATKLRHSSRALVVSSNVPDHNDLVFTHHSSSYTEKAGTNLIEELAVVIPKWQSDVGDPYYQGRLGPTLSLAAVTRWDVTNGFSRVSAAVP